MSTTLTEVTVIDDHTFLYLYDRLANDWHPIPETLDDMNSVWLVRVTVERGE